MSDDEETGSDIDATILHDPVVQAALANLNEDRTTPIRAEAADAWDNWMKHMDTCAVCKAQRLCNNAIKVHGLYEAKRYLAEVEVFLELSNRG
jgi:hypothetical protein